MEELILQPAALDLLEVAAMAAGPADPGFYVFENGVQCQKTSE